MIKRPGVIAGDYRWPHSSPFLRVDSSLSQRDYLIQPRVARNELPWGPRTLHNQQPRRGLHQFRGKKLALTAAGVYGLRAEYTGTIELARPPSAETVNLERTLCDLVTPDPGRNELAMRN